MVMKPEQITSIRKFLGYGYASFGKLMNPPVDKQTVKLLERGDLAISEDNAQKITYLSGVVGADSLRVFDDVFKLEHQEKEYFVIYRNDQDFKKFDPLNYDKYLGYSHFYNLALDKALGKLAILTIHPEFKNKKTICQIGLCVLLPGPYQAWLQKNNLSHSDRAMKKWAIWMHRPNQPPPKFGKRLDALPAWMHEDFRRKVIEPYEQRMREEREEAALIALRREKKKLQQLRQQLFPLHQEEQS